MPKKKGVTSIGTEDASQLSILAYQLRTGRNVADVQRFLDRLKSEHARHIGRVIVGEEDSVSEDTIRQADYYLRWAEETARTARQASRRPSGRSRLV
jgi:hypothetical protein